MRTGADPSEIEAYTKQLRASNDDKAHELDQLFMQNQRKEQDIVSVQREIDELQTSCQQKINQLDPQNLTRYSLSFLLLFFSHFLLLL